MRYYPLDIIQEIIEANPKITSLLGTTAASNEAGDMVDYPNVAQDMAPEGMERPYIVLREEADSMGENDLLGSALVSADVFVEGDNALAREIGSQIEKVFHNKRYIGEDNVGAGAVTTFIKFRYSPPQPDPSVKCRNVKILLNYCRDDLLEL